MIIRNFVTLFAYKYLFFPKTIFQDSLILPIPAFKLFKKLQMRSMRNFELSAIKSSRPEVFCKKGFLRNFAKFTGKQLCQCLFFNKVAGLRLWHRCLPVNFTKVLRTPFFIEHLQWVLLCNIKTVFSTTTIPYIIYFSSLNITHCTKNEVSH